MHEVWASEDERAGSHFLSDKWCALLFSSLEAKTCCIAAWSSVQGSKMESGDCAVTLHFYHNKE